MQDRDQAHLVGGLCFRTAEEAMQAVGSAAGDVISWIPDGEPGDRSVWVANPQLREIFKNTEGLHSEGDSGYTQRVSDFEAFGLDEGVDADQISIAGFGYAEAALESYATFCRLRSDGAIPQGARFQVSIPTTLALLMPMISSEDCKALEPVIEQGLIADVVAICGAIPADDLAIQWDVAMEFGVLEGRVKTGFADTLQDIAERLARLGDAVPEPVALAYHWCYGSPYDDHFADPADAGVMTRLANAMFERLQRSVQRLQLPVPIYRDDAAFYAPLSDLRLPQGAHVYLGLLHHEDGVDGAKRRIAAAKLALNDFGVSFECGTARTLAEPMALLRLHSQAAALLDDDSLDAVAVPEHGVPHTPPTLEESTVRVSGIALQVPCRLCGAEIATPCTNGEVEISRPHAYRYVDGVHKAVDEFAAA